MKRFSIIVMTVVVTTCIFYSCKKDDKKPDSSADHPTSPTINGTWNFVALKNGIPPGHTDYTHKVLDIFFEYEENCAQENTMTFEGGSDNAGTVLVFDNCEKRNNSDTWILQNNVLTIGNTDFQIKELGQSNLIMIFNAGSYGTTDPQKGYIKWGDIIDTFVLKRK